MPKQDPWAATAEFYDLDLEGVEDDVAMYRELTTRHGGAVLELGCGTGRVAVPLAEAGLEVTGVDLSAGMLAVAKKRAGKSTLKCVEGDMRAVRLRRTFGSV